MELSPGGYRYLLGARGALAGVRLRLDGLTVLIGENGSGKSTLIEAFELLHRAAAPGNFVNDQLAPFHGGLLEHLLSPSCEHHGIAFPHKRKCHRFANATARACYDRNFTCHRGVS